MGSRRSHLVLVLVMLFLPERAWAHNHWLDLSAAYSGGALSWIDGGRITITVPLPFKSTPAYAKRLNVVGEYAFHDGRHEGRRLDQDTWAVGLRRSLMPKGHTDSKNLPFAQLLWVVREKRKGGTIDGREGGFAVGGGFERVVKGSRSVAIGWRVQAEGVVLPSADEETFYPRFAAGIVLRFERN